MSYRIYAYKENGDNFQLFGNNVCPDSFISELIRQGCEVDEDGCFEKFEVKEIMPVINSIERYIVNKSKEIKEVYGNSIYDFSSEFDNYNDTLPLWLEIEMKIDYGYMFIIHNLLSFFKEELDKSAYSSYKIKDCCKIMFRGG